MQHFMHRRALRVCWIDNRVGVDAAYDDVSTTIGTYKHQKLQTPMMSVGSHTRIQKNSNEHISKSLMPTTSDEHMAYSQESVE
jgi:hypothetical protein